MSVEGCDETIVDSSLLSSLSPVPVSLDEQGRGWLLEERHRRARMLYHLTELASGRKSASDTWAQPYETIGEFREEIQLHDSLLTKQSS